MSLFLRFFFLPLAFCFLSSTVLYSELRAEPGRGYGAMFDSLDEVLAPCMEKGESCIEGGKSNAECQTVVELCLEELDNKAREEAIRNNPEIREELLAISAMERCTDTIRDCFEDTRAIDTCVLDVLRCEGESTDGLPCCPKGCVEDYKALLLNDTQDMEAFMQVFVTNGTGCFEGMPADPLK